MNSEILRISSANFSHWNTKSSSVEPILELTLAVCAFNTKTQKQKCEAED